MKRKQDDKQDLAFQVSTLNVSHPEESISIVSEPQVAYCRYVLSQGAD